MGKRLFGCLGVHLGIGGLIIRLEVGIGTQTLSRFSDPACQYKQPISDPSTLGTVL